jgi:beta-glucosidase
MSKKRILLTVVAVFITLSGCYSQPKESFITVKNTNGATIAYSPESGVKILTVEGLQFKDLNKNGKLDKYEDWRLPVIVLKTWQNR